MPRQLLQEEIVGTQALDVAPQPRVFGEEPEMAVRERSSRGPESEQVRDPVLAREGGDHDAGDREHQRETQHLPGRPPHRYGW